jgi:uncharacterized protein YaiE (UPF0345 family)
MNQKLFFYVAGIVLIILSACKKDPTASFIHSSDNYEAGDTINFTSTSSDANNFQWDFDDGNTSTDKNPWHIFNSTGTYEVSLKVTNDDGSDETSSSVVIKDPTILAFEVVKNETEEIISGCEVYIFDNEDDWTNWENPIDGGYTNTDGYIVFYHVKAIIYYVIAIKEEANGAWIGGGPTSTIVLNEINAYTVSTMWFTDEKKATFSETNLPKLLEKIN